MLFTYYWWHGLPLTFIQHELDLGILLFYASVCLYIYTLLYLLAHATPIDWANFCREVATHIVLNNSQKIGGPGVIVEINESEFGKSNSSSQK